MSDPHVVLLSSVTWDTPLVGRPRRLVEAWRRAGLTARYVEVPALRTLARRARGWLARRDYADVLTPWPPCPARLWHLLGERALRRLVAARARGLRRRLGRRIDWPRALAVVGSPVWAPWLDELPFARVVYDCLDEFSVQTPWTRLASFYRRWENELLARASAAVATTEALRHRLRARRPDLPVVLIRNGVDAEQFRARAHAAPRPPDLPAPGRPIIGFVGALFHWIDWPLIDRVAAALSDFDFVFVGPLDSGSPVPPAAARPNVFLLGPRPYERVPAYVRAFDVCWVPFAAGDVAAATNPVKIYEYLSLGKPVVSTPVADTDSFDNLVSVGRATEEIIDRLRAAVRHPPADVDARLAFARANSWDARARALLDFLDSLAPHPPAVAK